MKSNNKIIGLVVSAVLAIALIAFVFFSEYSDGDTDSVASATPTTPTTTPTTPVTPVTTTPPPVTTPKNYTALYKDGTYSANATYGSPGGQDEIAVSVTLKDDIITDATVTTVVADRTSQRYQNKFISGYKAYVIGKNIADIKLTVVSVSSLTPRAFDDALSQIKVQAKA